MKISSSNNDFKELEFFLVAETFLPAKYIGNSLFLCVEIVIRFGTEPVGLIELLKSIGFYRLFTGSWSDVAILLTLSKSSKFYYIDFKNLL